MRRQVFISGAVITLCSGARRRQRLQGLQERTRGRHLVLRQVPRGVPPTPYSRAHERWRGSERLLSPRQPKARSVGRKVGSLMQAITVMLIALAIECGCRGATRAPLPSSPSPVTPLVDLTGTYQLTLIASPSCSTVTGNDPLTHQSVPFPESLRTRMYPAQITQDAVGNAQIVLRRGECDPCTADGRGGALDANVSGRQLTFSVPGSDICAGGDYWWESLSPDREWFEVCGGWTAAVDDPAHISGIHAGTFAYHHLIDPSVSPLPNRGGAWVDIYCSATDHHFALTRTIER
jgi:hypothetical protein